MAQKQVYSWKAIIIALILFFPLGMYWAYKRATADRTAAFQKSSSLLIIGIAMIVFSLYAIGRDGSNADKDGAMGFTVFILILFGGLWMIRLNRKVRKTGERFIMYMQLIIEHNYTSIEDIASKVSLDTPKVVKELKEIVLEGYFAGIIIDETTNEIIYLGEKQREEAKAMQQRVITCNSCAAKNVIMAGSVSKCEYCGSPISET